jgi:pimeloyl-ACP methyl ester carboxylesterase
VSEGRFFHLRHAKRSWTWRHEGRGSSFGRRLGTALVEVLAPSRTSDERFRPWFARSARTGGGPDLVADFVRVNLEANMRALLPAISVPTLVLHREGNRFIDVGAGRYLAERIPNAKFVVPPARTTCSSSATPTPWWTKSKSS